MKLKLAFVSLERIRKGLHGRCSLTNLTRFLKLVNWVVIYVVIEAMIGENRQLVTDQPVEFEK